MPQKRKPKTPAKGSIQEARRNRRKLVDRKTRQAVERPLEPPAANPEWAKLPIAHKLDLVMSWSINGGSLFGERYSRYKLAAALGLKDDSISELIAKCESDFLKVCEERGELTRLVAKTITKLSYQLTEDRGRLVNQLETIEKERLTCRAAIEEAKGMPVTKPAERRARYLAISRYWQIYLDMTNQLTMATGQLSEHTKSSIKFIEIFNKKHGPGQEDDGKAGEKEKAITPETAYQIIEENSPQILPRQGDMDAKPGSRDPDAPFKVLREAHE